MDPTHTPSESPTPSIPNLGLPKRPLRFLDIPPEIRRLIYAHLFEGLTIKIGSISQLSDGVLSDGFWGQPSRNSSDIDWSDILEDDDFEPHMDHYDHLLMSQNKTIVTNTPFAQHVVQYEQRALREGRQ